MGANAVKAVATDYVAVIAMMPPAAPAKEWIEESPGIIESCKCSGNERGGKFPSKMTSDVTCDITVHNERLITELKGFAMCYKSERALT